MLVTVASRGDDGVSWGVGGGNSYASGGNGGVRARVRVGAITTTMVDFSRLDYVEVI